MNKGSEHFAVSHALAVSFDKIVALEVPGGASDIVPITGAMAILFSTYCIGLHRADQMIALSQFVDSVLRTFNDNPISDLLLH